MNPTIPRGGREQYRRFTKAHPDINLVAQAQVAAAGQTMESMQKLMTAIAAGVPPDVTIIDRFVVGGWAARGALRPLDDLIGRDRFLWSDFYEPCRDEATYKGHIYAIPTGTDNRGLYWNKRLFREAGLDPDRPPRDWAEIVSYAKRLNRTDQNGAIITLGFSPIYGQNALYLYGWQNGGEFMSPDGERCTMNDPNIVAALDWLVNLCDALGGAEQIGAFGSSFQGEDQHPFLNGRIAMIVDGNWILGVIARYRPDLDFGVAPVPMPDERQPPISWAGGWAWAIPRGTRNVEGAWTTIKWLIGPQGHKANAAGEHAFNQRLHSPYVVGMTGNGRIDRELASIYNPLLQNDHLAQSMEMFLGLMPVSRFRPVTPVGAELWNEQARAVNNAIYHKMTPQQALDTATANVQRALDEFFRWHP
ncbi:MAG: ABC transporter substrate-binding protein [Candidatus Latescibacteria bacterium]|nr:ABC transporter substrate-binding protein [Candidatus Latescibacterota bacterium]